MEDPETFFTELGEQADAEIKERYLEYAGPDTPEESTEDKQTRLAQAMNRSVEEVFAELVTPEPGQPGRARPDAEIPPARGYLLRCMSAACPPRPVA